MKRFRPDIYQFFLAAGVLFVLYALISTHGLVKGLLMAFGGCLFILICVRLMRYVPYCDWWWWQ